MAEREIRDEEDTVAGADADDDALLVLTALLLTPARFPSVLGDDYVAACGALALEPYEEGYGLVLGQDGDGARWTVVVEDVSLVAVAIAAWDCGMEYDLSPDDRSVVCALPGWPLALTVAAPGVPAPHDPETGGVGPAPLSPPDAGSWGPAQRRLGADEIAERWAQWREQIDDAQFVRPGGEPAGQAGNGEQGGEDTAAEGDAEPGGAATGRHPGVRRALAEALAYTKTPPPPGRIRSGFASADARTLRVDGPGWSMVARTDDIALILLDEEPGEVLPVGRGPALPGLLKALDALALHPA
ncbi:hypothetical protein [Streptomyces sp. KY70]|uniref:hypothetical protein n=1 Tax=Streptomyces sp. KY70 TaxID=2772432 RepID=UPI001AFB630A|nr:hypothetical protein [Streptomyces sp. KY70]CAD5913744.1 conserved protein of unknown function [Streptomyces sp. KY70]CAD5994364.1 conserved protein of unknown function [Streptomyces sp. KY75]